MRLSFAIMIILWNLSSFNFLFTTLSLLIYLPGFSVKDFIRILDSYDKDSLGSHFGNLLVDKYVAVVHYQKNKHSCPQKKQKKEKNNKKKPCVKRTVIFLILLLLYTFDSFDNICCFKSDD